MLLLIGSTGLLGHNVLVNLLQRGEEVMAPVRDPSRLHIPNPADIPNLHIVPMDGVRFRLPTDCPPLSAIINCAGTTDMSLTRYDDYIPVNKELVEHLVMLMRSHNIPTLVHVSTANTIGYGTTDKPADENAPFQAPFTGSLYAQSKRDTEEMLEWLSGTQAANGTQAALPAAKIVVVNPGFMVGPYDTKPSSGKLLMAAYKRRWMAVPKGGKSFVHVRDVAEAVVNAVTMGVNGERYLLTGTPMTLKEFYALQAQVCGYQQKIVELPNWLVLLAGRVGDMMRWMHIRTQLCTRNVRQLLVCEYYDNSKAIQQLHMPQTPIADAIKEFFYNENDNENENR